jgi:hypothetical protein
MGPLEMMLFCIGASMRLLCFGILGAGIIVGMKVSEEAWKMKNDYRRLMAAGNAAQLEKLKENGHKEGFEHIGMDYAWKRLEEEMAGLSRELRLIPLTGPGYYKAIRRVRREAADVANFAHMIILTCDELLRE